LGRTDVLNLCLLLVGFLGVLILLPPVHSFPITDDWTYAHSVGDLLNLRYTLDASQATALGHLAWGAIFAAIWGLSFTVLTVSNLLMSVAGIILFYLLLRHLEVTSAWALFGSALLGLNPIYLHLGYTFMTDITFIVYLLAGCLCYVRVLQGHGDKWLWIGSIVAALAYLTRQYGILLVPAILLSLWWYGQWTWRRVAAAALVPVVVAAIYMLWERAQPTTMTTYYLASLNANVRSPVDYWIDHVFRIAWAVSITGALMLPLIWMPRNPWRVLPLVSLLGILLLKSWQIYGTLLPVTGNMIDNTGFLLDDYPAISVWSQGIWAIPVIVGMLVFSLYIVACAEQVGAWLRAKPWQNGRRIASQDPILLVYTLMLPMSGAILFLTPFVFDRYLLPVLPLLSVAILRLKSRGNQEPGLRYMWWRWLLLAPLALFGILAQRDFMEHSSVRWEGAERLVATGVPREHINAGFEWLGWYLFDEGAQRIRQRGDFSRVPFPPNAVLDPVYMLSDVSLEGYVRVGALPYESWLSGGQTRQVLVLKRGSQP
jgi:4-amino-4-deoxy-L-arabinose transferase-like glycosyltransferase